MPSLFSPREQLAAPASAPLTRVPSDESVVSSSSSAGSWSSETPILRAQSGDYHVLRVLGKGSSSVVYECVRSGQAKRTKYALKVSRSSRTTFSNEAALQNAIASNTKTVMPVLDDRLDTGYSCLIMPAGSTLDNLPGKVSNTMMCWIVKDIGGALALAHSMGIAHGDIKPEQFLAAKRQPGQRQRFCLSDWGFGSTERFCEIRGSPAFMHETAYAAFERWAADRDYWEHIADEDARFDPETGIAVDMVSSDLYGLAFSILVLLCGDQLAHFPSDASLQAWHKKCRFELEWTLASLGLSDDACQVLAMGLSPTNRCRSMRVFVEAAMNVERWKR